MFEKTKPDFRVRMWLCDQFCGETLFEGRETDTRTLAVSMPMFSKAVTKANTVRIAADLSIGKLDFHKSMTKGDQKSTSGELQVPGEKRKFWEKVSPRKDKSPRKGDEKEKGDDDKSPRWNKKSPRKEKKEKKDQSKSPRIGGGKSTRGEKEEPKGGSEIVSKEKGKEKKEVQEEPKAGTQIVVKEQAELKEGTRTTKWQAHQN